MINIAQSVDEHNGNSKNKTEKSKRSQLLESALDYANQGWSVLPVHSVVDGTCSCDKADCGTPGKHPRISGWQDNATVSPGIIKKMVATVAGRQSRCGAWQIVWWFGGYRLGLSRSPDPVPSHTAAYGRGLWSSKRAVVALAI